MTDARRTQHLEREIDRLRAEGRPFAVATIVRTVDATSAKPGAKAVVIGGGLLGLEAAAGLALRGMEVTVIHLMGHLMERQLDPAAGYLLQKALEAKGIRIHCKGATKAILGHGRVEAVVLEDGTTYGADLVVMAVGIRPDTALAKAAGLETGRGIIVDDHMVTSDPSILAVGECVEHRGACYGLVAPLWDMCHALADGLAETPTGYTGSVTSTKLKVSGIDLFSAGDFSGGEGTEDIVLRDAHRGIYKRLVVAGDKLIGAVLYGDTADGNWYFQLLKDGTDIAPLRDNLIFGQAFAGTAHDPSAAVAALSPQAEICGCNGVSKGTICGAIADGATTLDALRTTLSFRRNPMLGGRPLTEAGPWAIQDFIESPEETRFLQSFKSFAASRSLPATQESLDQHALRLCQRTRRPGRSWRGIGTGSHKQQAGRIDRHPDRWLDA